MIEDCDAFKARWEGNARFFDVFGINLAGGKKTCSIKECVRSLSERVKGIFGESLATARHSQAEGGTKEKSGSSGEGGKRGGGEDERDPVLKVKHLGSTLSSGHVRKMVKEVVRRTDLVRHRPFYEQDVHYLSLSLSPFSLLHTH